MPLTAREAARLILEKGGRKVRSGSKHDIYHVNGTDVVIPRYKGNLSPKVERDVRKALGK